MVRSPEYHRWSFSEKAYGITRFLTSPPGKSPEYYTRPHHRNQGEAPVVAAAVSRRNLPLCHRGRIATGASPSPSCQPVFVPYKRLARRCRFSAAIRGKLYPPEVINHFWQSICLRSSPHKYSPIRQFFTNSSYFSGLVKFS